MQCRNTARVGPSQLFGDDSHSPLPYVGSHVVGCANTLQDIALLTVQYIVSLLSMLI